MLLDDALVYLVITMAFGPGIIEHHTLGPFRGTLLIRNRCRGTLLIRNTIHPQPALALRFLDANAEVVRMCESVCVCGRECVRECVRESVRERECARVCESVKECLRLLDANAELVRV